MTDPMKDSEKITLRNMAYSGYVGVSEREHEIKTRLEIDVEIFADLKRACTSDALDDTIDYGQLYDLVGKIIGGKHHNLLESLAEEISDAVFGLYDCGKIIVRVRKPQPPLNGPCDCAEVELVRHKVNRE